MGGTVLPDDDEAGGSTVDDELNSPVEVVGGGMTGVEVDETTGGICGVLVDEATGVIGAVDDVTAG